MNAAGLWTATRSQTRARLGRSAVALVAALSLATGCATAPARPVGPASVTATPELSSVSVPPSRPTSVSSNPASSPQVVSTVHVQVQPGSGSKVALRALDFTDAEHGWAAGKGVILGTDNGGARWGLQYAGPADISQLDFADASHGWAVASASLLVTTDGGAHWRAAGEPAAAPLQSVDFVSTMTGFGVTRKGLARSNDAGEHWVSLPTSVPAPASSSSRASSAAPPPTITAVCFNSPMAGWAAAVTSGPVEGPELLRTTDGGQHWTVSFTPQGGTVEQLRCAGAAAWAEIGGGAGMNQHPYTVFRTEDGGKHWGAVLTITTAGAGPGPGPAAAASRGPGGSPGPLALAGPASAVFFGECVPCGGAGTLQPTSTTDGGVTWTNGPLVAGADVYGGTIPGAPAALFLPNGHGWLTAPDGSGGSTILATEDRGHTWTEQYPVSSFEPLTAIDFTTAATGFGLGSLGDGAAVLATADGGRSWRRIAELPGQNGNPSAGVLSFADALHGWAINGDGALLATADGGVHWTPVATGGKGPLVAAVLLSPHVGCVSDYNSQKPLCTADGGVTWKAANAAESLWSTAATLAGVPLAARLAGRYPKINAPIVGGATGPSSAWIADYLELDKTADAGTTWTRYLWQQGGPGLAIDFVDPVHGWYLGGDGLYRTTDGGLTWAWVGGA